MTTQDARADRDRVAELARTIPPGRVASYGQLGDALGLHPRAVGRHVASLGDEIPWWRVVRSDGSPASCHGGAAPQLLHDEGTPFRGARVSSNAFTDSPVRGKSED